MKIKQLVDRFGSNRLNAHEPAKFFAGCTCIAVPFAGGLCEVPHFKANVILVNDLDRHVMNCATIVRDNPRGLAELCDLTLFHPDELRRSQQRCLEYEEIPPRVPDLSWAYNYYVASWMTRGGKMGTKGEFEQGLSVRWKSGGGDSVVRFRNATEGIAEWSEAVRHCTFTTLDAFEFLGECKKRDIDENGIYCDPPWVGDGDNYKHSFSELVNWCDGKFAPIERVTKHEALARMLAGFKHTRIVVRYGDCDEVQRLYPESHWEWHRLESRTQANKSKSEVLLVNKV